MQLIKGTELKRGDYRIIDVLGQGGFGITYLAQQIGLGRKVAIKEFFMKDLCNRGVDGSQVSAGSAGSKDLVERFKQKFLKEARLIASFNNAHIIRIHDVFEENGTAYYVMEYLEGESLKEVVDNNGALPETVAVKYILQVADALSAVHANNLLHLDVKPANIMLDENCNAVLIDFGVSKHYDEKGAQTSSAGVGLSEGYAPLEQYEAGSLKDFTPATDIYALGATLFMLLTGTRPPKASVVNDDGLPPMPTAISAPVRKAVEKAMQPRRKDRPQNIDEFVKLLKLPNPKPNNNKWQWIAILLLIIICGALGGFMLFGGGNDVKRDSIKDTPVQQPIVEQTAELIIEGAPDSANVYVDGNFIGKTPLERKTVPLGEHTIKIEKECYETYEKQHTFNNSNTPVTVKATLEFATHTFRANGVEFTMVAVEGGTFSMGSNDGYDNQKPIHQVTLDSYCIGQTEVTQALWQAVMDSNPSYFKGTSNPVEKVSYNDCIDFVNKLNTLLKDQLPQGRKFRLPTEAEWEFAARGGNKSKGCKYSGSNSISTVAWYDGNSGRKTHPVKQKAGNELGLYDMSGNVWEWCSDWYGYDYYSSSPQNNPKGPGNGSNRVLRGGSWYCDELNSRSANRNNGGPGYRIDGCGLRLAF